MRRFLAVLAVRRPGPRRSRRAAAMTTAATRPARRLDARRRRPTSGSRRPGELTVASDIPYAPFEFTDPGSTEAKGFDVDLVKAIARDAGHHRRQVRGPALRHDHPEHQAGPLRHVGLLVDDHPGAREAGRTSATPTSAPTRRSWSRRTTRDITALDDLAGQDDRRAARDGRRRPRPRPSPAPRCSATTPSDDAFNALAQGRVDAAITDFPVVGLRRDAEAHAQGGGRGAGQPRRSA